VKRYTRAVLGGFLAILAAFGWMVAIVFLVSLKSPNIMVGVRLERGLWLFLFLTFSAGFYLSFRAAYGLKISS
jgi:hypothetical protein